MDRRIDPTRRRPDGSPDDNDRVEIGPTALAFAEWAAAGLETPDLAAMRRLRLDRLVAEIAARDLGGLLLFDPLNIRYATDSTNMQVWNAHNSFPRLPGLPRRPHGALGLQARAVARGAQPAGGGIRSGACFVYSLTGEATDAGGRRLRRDVADIVRARAGRNRRLAVDKIMLAGYRALDAAGLDIEDGEP